jgi:hypothetical protein
MKLISMDAKPGTTRPARMWARVPTVWLFAALWWGPALEAAVKTARQPVVNEYHGVKVADDYQWLENGPTRPCAGATLKQQARAPRQAADFAHGSRTVFNGSSTLRPPLIFSHLRRDVGSC